ncbi:MAG: phosphoglycerate dehydrogenase [Chloroflexi bacterium]|nr:phosphoglycerate dehydrogenase [Chloroflexota bacterium]
MARVLLTTMQVSSATDDLLRPLIEAGHELVLLPNAQAHQEDILAEAATTSAAAITGVEPWTRRVIESAPDLKIISRTGVGYDAIDIDAANDNRVLVATTPGANHHSVAEAAIGLILAALRRFAHADHQMRTTGWNPRPYGVELRNKTVGVIGTGLIGKEVVKRLQGWEVTILVSDVVRDTEFAERYGVQYVELPELFAAADVITVHAPLLPSTHHLVSETVLRAMKPTAYLVNTSRGPLVDEAALAIALKEGWIAGAALDVFETEPLAANSPLLGLRNITLTQHIAGVTWESMQAMTAMAVESVAAVLRGEVPRTIVNPRAARS